MHQTGGWVGPRTGPDAVERGEVSSRSGTNELLKGDTLFQVVPETYLFYFLVSLLT
jgi:hypothetical protein